MAICITKRIIMNGTDRVFCVEDDGANKISIYQNAFKISNFEYKKWTYFLYMLGVNEFHQIKIDDVNENSVIKDEISI